MPERPPRQKVTSAWRTAGLRSRGWIGRTLLVGLALLSPGCTTVGYYYQAAAGQWELMRAARPIEEWVDDPATPAELRVRLQAVRDIRVFASRELGLPDNASYRAYADLHRPFVVWNVVAASEFSTHPRQWCFPFTGCVSYKGWFSAEAAEQAGEQIRAEGYDVFVYGVPAYSTLGWFADPVLNTYIRLPRQELARLVFHELAHQVAYVAGDSTFNESFATCVEQIGVRRWLDRNGTEQERVEFESMDRRKEDFVRLILDARAELDRVYAGPAHADEMRRAKSKVFEETRARYEELKRKWGGFAGYDRWFAKPLTNAHVASVATYADAVPAFERLLGTLGGDLTRFYEEARRLARADETERARVLDLPVKTAGR